MSVLGRPQKDWDDFLEEASKPKKRWTLGKVLLIAVPVVVVAAILIHHYAG